ncbi:MAG: transposase [Colwellia sp.]|nr:transposase [Colwellia sp.]
MSKNKQRKHYSDEFKEEALRLSEKIGVAQASRELGVYSSQLYYWRSSAVKKASSSDRENTLAIDVLSDNISLGTMLF